MKWSPLIKSLNTIYIYIYTCICTDSYLCMCRVWVLDLFGCHISHMYIYIYIYIRSKIPSACFWLSQLTNHSCQGRARSLKGKRCCWKSCARGNKSRRKHLLLCKARKFATRWKPIIVIMKFLIPVKWYWKHVTGFSTTHLYIYIYIWKTYIYIYCFWLVSLNSTAGICSTCIYIYIYYILTIVFFFWAYWLHKYTSSTHSDRPSQVRNSLLLMHVV